jgi:hypothetical protein
VLAFFALAFFALAFFALAFVLAYALASFALAYALASFASERDFSTMMTFVLFNHSLLKRKRKKIKKKNMVNYITKLKKHMKKEGFFLVLI